MSGRLLDPIPNKYDDPGLKKMFMTVQLIFNSLTGAWLRDGSVSNAKLSLSSRGIAPSRINFGEWSWSLCPFVTSTTSTTFVLCSDIFSFNPTHFPPGAWHFEASIATGVATDTVFARLMGVGEIAGSPVSHTGNINLTLRRSGALTMPGGVTNLFVEVRTSNAATAARFAGARLIFIPN